MTVIQIIKGIAIMAIAIIAVSASRAKKPSQKNSQKQDEKPLNAMVNIWEQDDNALFESIYDYLCDKSDYGHNLSKLNEQKKSLWQWPW